MHASLQLLVALAVAGLLGRAVRPAWHNRLLAVAVWRRVRPRHVLGCLALLSVVLAVALGLMRLVPVTAYGLGTPLGIDGNAVFAPLQEASRLAEEATAPRPGEPGAPVPVREGPNWAVLAVWGGFLGLLLVLFPWLAYVEERAFRQGLERAGLRRQLQAALRFGLVHLVMLVPLAAALAIAVAGFAYGRIYRRAYRRALGAPPDFLSPFGPRRIIETPRRRARTEAVLATTVWHTTFNSLIVLIVLTGFLLSQG